jgi:hypothetical protein
MPVLDTRRGQRRERGRAQLLGRVDELEVDQATFKGQAYACC